MSRICRECRAGTLKVVGLGGFDDTIIVQCSDCEEEYELEPDGLDEGCMEFVEAFELELQRREGANTDEGG